MVQFNEEKQKERLQALREKEEEELAKILSAKYGVGYIDLTTVPIKTDALKIASEKKSREAGAAVFDRVGKKIKIAVISPQNQDTLEFIKKIKESGYAPAVYMTSKQSLEKAWGRYKEIIHSSKTKAGVVDISDKNITEIIAQVDNLEKTRAVLKKNLDRKSVRYISLFFETILAGAFAVNASDIHIEPEENYVSLRFRLDGVLTDIFRFDRKIYNLLLSRIKLISGLKITIVKKPQDGRFSIKMKDKDIEIRVSVLPDAYGESIVLRLLNPDTIAVSMENLGIEPHLFEILNREIGRPNGMILNTGPTGSGKTTTLYAFLKKIHSPEIKIITIENPIEYHLPGVVQTQVDPKKGYTFLEGLRSSLRQDPDIIMVGEIRDGETAKIAINSALTGHLVFSTLHTNNAAGAFYRLVDLGVQPSIISAAINVIIAQRLVRKPCKYCARKIELEGADKQIIDEIISEIDNIGAYTANTTKIYKIVGCPKCNNTGYKGRIGIFEALLADSETEKILEQNPDKSEIKKIFKRQGLLSLAQDGAIKVLKGLTTIAELKRVVDLN